MRLFVLQRVTMTAAKAALTLAAVAGIAAAQEVNDAAVSETAETTETTHTIAVSVNPANGGSVSRNPNQIYYRAGTNVNIMAAPAAGYKFIGWSGDAADTANPLTLAMDGNKTLVANFQYTLKTYTLTTRTYPADGGLITRSPDKEEYAAGEEVVLTATPEPGHAFTGWAGVVAGRSNRLTVVMDGEKTVTANFYKQSMSAARKPSAPKPKKGERRTTWGLGAHWGADYSMSMKNGGEIMFPPGGEFDLTHFPGFEISIDPELPDGSDIPDDITAPDEFKIAAPYIKTSRSEWKSSALNIGGKIFVDVVPFIETIELSGNLGVWQYNCVASYLDVDSIREIMQPGVDSLRGWPEGRPYPYKDVPLALKDYGLNYFGLEGTPYAKLHLDLSARKTVFNLWRVKFNLGAGASVHFATPILSGNLIDAVKNDRNIQTAEELVEAFMVDDGKSMGEDILKKIISETLTPRFGAHVAAGAHLKLSVIGIYVDGKFFIPISKYDENRQVKPAGLLINTGFSLSF